MPPPWLTWLARASLIVAFACAAYIIADIFIRHYRQDTGIMEIVWPVSRVVLRTFRGGRLPSMGPSAERSLAVAGREFN